jgi:two-component system chemotaxis sensor kinase CheA
MHTALEGRLQQGGPADQMGGEHSRSNGFSKPPRRSVASLEEENDKELFSIFLEQLNRGLQQLQTLSEQLKSGHNAEEFVNDCLEILHRLRSSANYMEYDELCKHYDEWIHSMVGFQSECASGKTGDPSDFVDALMISKIEWFRNEFEGFDESEATVLRDSEQDQDALLLSRLASAFDENIGQSAENIQSSFSLDIENDLFSREIDGDSPLEKHAYGQRSQGSHVFSTDPLVPADEPTRPKPLEQLSRASEFDAKVTVTDRRSPFQFGRRQEDKAGERIAKQSIRVDAAKIDTLMNQVGELVVRRSGFSQLFNEMRNLQTFLKQTQKLNKREFQQVKTLTNKISEATIALGRVTAELQENVMRVRMLPLAQLFSRYPRLVHDLARNTNKKVHLDIHGEETELDKMVIEQIADPLVHIIRNAVDHGIEDAIDRQRRGKPETGNLCLEAYHEGSYVVIDISDDGRGIDPDQIKECALSKGFLSSLEAEQMDEREIISLILQPGFSTAEEVTHTSGRGVGMDVVKDHIEKLNGTLDIISTPGAGVLFRIKIPLTLAIIPALMVTVAGELMTIPLSTVDETLRIGIKDISTIEGLEVYYLRENAVPLIRLNQVFNMPSQLSRAQDVFVVVVNSGSRQIGLMVDDLNGREEVVIKPLEDYLQEKSGFSGATILGDGRISLILDISEIVQLATSRHARGVNAAVV